MVSNVKFTVESDLNKHIASVHEVKKPFECKICYAVFDLKNDMDNHIASIHEKEKQFLCCICNAIQVVPTKRAEKPFY